TTGPKSYTKFSPKISYGLVRQSWAGASSLKYPIRRMPHKSEDQSKPHKNGHVDENLRNHGQERQIEGFAQPERAYGVHAQGESHSPIRRVIPIGTGGNRHFFDEMSPYTQKNQQGNPPGTRCPEKQGKAFYKRKDFPN